MSAPLPRTLSVLLVEDSPADGRLLLETFKPAIAAGEVIVQTVKTLALAFEALKAYDFSCVLLDLGLPDGRGVDSVRALREIDRKTAIIVLTGLADEKLAAEALTQGAQDYLVKGESDGEQLFKQLRRAVQRNRQTYALEIHRDKAFFEASHDSQTLLPNAALFADRARQQLLGARTAGVGVFTLAYFLVQGLDALRAREGSLRVSELLKTLAERWSENLHAGDTLGRLSADGFGVLRQAAASPAEWATLITNCQQQMQQTLQAQFRGDHGLRLQCAVVQATDEMQGVDDLLALAEAQASDSLLSVADLPVHAASAADVLPPMGADGAWQPWVDVSTRSCAGFAFQPPPALIDATGAGDLATLAAADALIQQAKTWDAARFNAPLLALDVAATALASKDFSSRLIARFSTAGISPNRVQLEISEAAFRQLAQHFSALTLLRNKGFRLLLKGDGSQDISLHDFAACPLDGYKLSPALVRTLMDESLQGTARRLISAILGAAQQLGAVVIATGVDTEAAVVALRLIGVRLMQGRALLPPLAAESVPMAYERNVSIRG